MSTVDTITKSDFLAGMRLFASSVCVITAAQGEHMHGVTVTSLASVSIEPPTLLVCIHRDSQCAAAIQATGLLCVNLLSEQAGATARLFAGASPEARHLRFENIDWTEGRTGCPILAESLCAFECRVEQTMQVATHNIFFASVIDARNRPGSPLLYADRAFRRLDATEPQQA